MTAPAGAGVKRAVPRRTRLGYLGPAIVLVGAAFAGVAIWYMQTQRPVPGALIDTIDIGAGRSIAVREEAKSDRSFVELRDGESIVWRALIPHYAGAFGRRAIAWSSAAVTVRVERNGRAEVFVFAMQNAHKLGAFRLAAEREPIRMHVQGPITLTDNARSYELVGGDDWHQLIAVDLMKGGGVWKVDLGPEPIASGSVEAGRVWLQQGSRRRSFDTATGHENPDVRPLN